MLQKYTLIGGHNYHLFADKSNGSTLVASYVASSGTQGQFMIGVIYTEVLNVGHDWSPVSD